MHPRSSHQSRHQLCAVGRCVSPRDARRAPRPADLGDVRVHTQPNGWPNALRAPFSAKARLHCAAPPSHGPGRSTDGHHSVPGPLPGRDHRFFRVPVPPIPRRCAAPEWRHHPDERAHLGTVRWTAPSLQAQLSHVLSCARRAATRRAAAAGLRHPGTGLGPGGQRGSGGPAARGSQRHPPVGNRGAIGGRRPPARGVPLPADVV